MIGFAGLSHLGIVSSFAAAAKGFSVVGFDADAVLCRDLPHGRLPIVEPDLPALLASARERMTFSPDPGALAPCDVIYVSTDVPTDTSGQSDLRPITALVEQVAAANRSATVVILSQVPPGFTRALAARNPLLSEARLYYQVETLIFGRAVERAMYPERYIVGAATPGLPLPQPYAALLAAFGCPVLTMRYESAELAKIAINHFLAASVGMTNTLAELCEAIGADWSEIVPALRLDRRIGPHAYLTPGLGIGGGNIERDLATSLALASQRGTDAGIVQAIVRNSCHRRDWALREVQRAIQAHGYSAARIAVWGLAYKADTASTKNSPALALVEALERVSVHAYDPQAHINGSYPHLTVVSAPLEACRQADVLVVMTPWKEFAAVEIGEIKRAMRGRAIVDPFAVLDGARCVAEGFSYSRLGRPPDA